MRFNHQGRSAFFTLRAKILLAFFGLTAMTACLGLSAINGAVESGRLLVHTYDGPLMAIAHAGKAEADFATMRLVLAHHDAAAGAALREQADRELDTLARQVDTDLAVMPDRAGSSRAAAMARSALDSFSAWNSLRLQTVGEAADTARSDAMDRQAQVLLRKLDALRQTAVDDSASDRVLTLASTGHYRLVALATTVVALLLGTLIAVLLTHQVLKPIAEVSRAASRIAAGELDVEIQPPGRDELGRLLTAVATMRDNIRAMVERERTARRSAHGRLATALDGLNEGIALIGNDRRLILRNGQFATFFPAHATDLVEGVMLPPGVEAALAGPTGEMHISDGRWLRLSKSERSDGGFVLVASDITSLKEREAALRAAKEQAEASNRAKTEFVTNMSHELRTPLTAIIGFSEIIANESFGPVGQPRYREFADDILHSGRHLLEVINDMLDIAKLQSGMTELRLQRVPSHGIVESAVRIVRKRAEEAGVALELAIPPDMPIIEVDHLRMRQVLLNLLSNAIKFTPDGGKVSVIAERHDAALAITVRDTGIGMAPEDIPRALQPFVQVDNSLARRHGGTGLGLPLAKLFVDLHGGQFTIRSALGKGTSVTIVLPTSVAIASTMIAGKMAA